MPQVIPCIGWTITSWSPLTNPNVGIIVPETCGTIYKILQIEYFTIIYYINVNNTTYWVTWCIIYIFIYLGHKYLVSIICNVVAGLTQSHPDRPLAAIYDLPRSAISGQRAPVYTELMFLWFQLVFNIFSIIG